MVSPLGGAGLGRWAGRGLSSPEVAARRSMVSSRNPRPSHMCPILFACPKMTNATMVQMLDRVVWPRGPSSLICVPASLPPTTMEAPNMDTCPKRLVIEARWGSKPLA
eukprot:COSAG01_NODE_26814_length_702_cov_1.495854_1_plen_107_part_10